MPAGTASHDLVIIGGGINGAGIARDAALRGLSVLLLEAQDFGGGTSSWSSRLIHGGLRYLEYGEIPLVYESLHERRRLRRIAGHLVRPLRLTIPLYRGGRRPPWMVRAGLLAYDLLSIGKSLPRHCMLNRAALLAEYPGLNAEGLRAGARYYDAQVTFAERLVIENVVAAAAAGAEVHNYAPAVNITRTADGRHEVAYRDAGGDTCVATAPCVVNAAGPWVDRVLALADGRMPRLMGGTKGSHVVVDRFAGVPDDAFYVEAPADGRPVFVIPWNGQLLIGTTDQRYDGDPRDARASIAEADYLLHTVNTLFPHAALTRSQVNFAYAGVRPLPYVAKGPESAITRRHIIHRHRGAAHGLLSVVGGKLTTYRNLAEQVVDRVVRATGNHAADCRTGREPLPGGGEQGDVAAMLSGVPGLQDGARERLAALYGRRCARLAALCRAQPLLAEALDRRGRVIAAEVALAVREEYARTLVDIVHRRLMTGLDADQGEGVARAVAAVAERELGWDATRRDAELADLARYNERLRLSPP